MWRSTGWFFRLHKSKGLPCPTFSLQLQACLVFTACIQHFLELQTYLVFTACIQHFLQLQAYLVFTASAASTLLVARTICARAFSHNSEEGGGIRKGTFYYRAGTSFAAEAWGRTRAQLMGFVRSSASTRTRRLACIYACRNDTEMDEPTIHRA